MTVSQSPPSGTILKNLISLNNKQVKAAERNLAGAHLDNYAKEEILVGPTVVGGNFYGVEITGRTQSVDDSLVEEIRKGYGKVSQLEKLFSLQGSMEDFFGKKGSQSSFIHGIETMKEAIMTLAKNAGNPNQKPNAANSIDTALRRLNETAESVQEMRGRVDEEIGKVVEKANNKIQVIAELNQEIAALCRVGEKNSEKYFTLVNERRGHIHELAKYVGGDVNDVNHGVKNVLVESSPLGLHTHLVQGGSYAQLNYTVSGAVAPETALSDVTITGLSTAPLNVTQVFQNVDQGGQIKALLVVRDQYLKGLQDQLDEFTMHLHNELNALHNEGTALTQHDHVHTLTGTVGAPGLSTPLVGTDILSGSGKLRLSVINPTTGASLFHYDHVLGDNVTLQQFVDDMNNAIQLKATTVPTSNIKPLLSLTADGRMKIQVVDTNTNAPNTGYGLAIGNAGDTPAKISAGGVYNAATAYGVSHFFGLNNLLETSMYVPGGSKLGIAQKIKIRPDILASRGEKIAMGHLSNQEPDPKNPAVAGGDVSILDAIGHKISDDENIVFAGSVMSTPVTTSISKFGVNIIDSHATRTSLNREEISTRIEVLDAMRKRSGQISSVDLKEVLQQFVDLGTNLGFIGRAMSILNEMRDEILKIR